MRKAIRQCCIRMFRSKRGQALLARIVSQLDLWRGYGAGAYVETSGEEVLFTLVREKVRDQTETVIFDVGANVGEFSAVAFKSLGSGIKIHAFEPSQKAFLRLCENLRLNKVSNVSAFNCAIGSSTGFVPFFEPEGHLTNGSLNRGFAELFSAQVNERPVILVDGRALDGLISGDRPVLMKIDVEGAESEVLRSLRSFILSRFPDIVVEVLPDDAEDLNAIEFIGTTYRRFNITDGGLIEKTRFEASSRFRDYLLLPNQAARHDQPYVA